MKTIPKLVLIGSLLGATPVLRAETLAEALERGVFLEETQRDPAAALKVYQQLLDQESQSREIASEARYRMATCLIALGEEPKGRAELEALAADGAATKDWAKKAAESLGKAQFIQPAPWKPSGEVAIYRTLGPGNQDMGFMMSVVRSATAPDGKPAWESFFIRAGGQWGISRSLFSQENYQPITARFFMDGIGDYLSDFPAAGAVVIKKFGVEDEVVWEREAGESTFPLFDNDQMTQMLRVVPQEIGTKVSCEIVIPINPAPVSFTMEVTAEETVQTDAGSFDCVKIVTNIGQDFWVSRDANKRLIKIKMGVATIQASKFADWDPAKATEYISHKQGARVSIPAGVLLGPPTEKEKGLRLWIYPADLSALGGIIDIRPISDLPESSRKSSAAWAKTDLVDGAKQFEEFVTEEEKKAELGGMTAAISRTRERRGEIGSQHFHVHALGKSKGISIRLAYPEGNEEAAEKLAMELARGISLD